MINVPWPRGARRDATTRHRRLLVQSHHCLLRPREAAATAWLSPPRILITSERTRGRTWQKRARWISRRLMRRFISLTFQSIIVHPWDRAAALCSLVSPFCVQVSSSFRVILRLFPSLSFFFFCRRVVAENGDGSVASKFYADRPLYRRRGREWKGRDLRSSRESTNLRKTLPFSNLNQLDDASKTKDSFYERLTHLITHDLVATC